MPNNPLLVFLLLLPLALQQTPCMDSTNGCKLCWDSYACNKCLPAHYAVMVNGFQQCKACPIGCTACTSSMCTGCEIGLVQSSGACLCPLGKGIKSYTEICVPCALPNCISCGSNYTECVECTNSHGPVQDSLTLAYSCVPCSNPNCISCPNNPDICIKCVIPLGVNAGSCSSCNNANCLDCSKNSNTCRKCADGYGVDGSFGCSVCLYSYCIKCSQSIYKCEQCQTGYGLNGPKGYATNCVICRVRNCSLCNGNFRICQQCAPGFTLTSNNQCQSTSCSVANCLECAVLPMGCSYCSYGYGWNSGTNQCQSCSDPNCLRCPLDIANCETCVLGKGPSSGFCGACSSSDCDYCPFGVGSCRNCVTLGMGANLNAGTCVSCSLSTCANCSSGFLGCEVCNSGFGVVVDGFYSCASCKDTLCSQCSSNYLVCTSCQSPYGLRSNNTCWSCAVSLCALCPSSINTCTRCLTGYGPSADGSSCLSCLVPNCQVCSTNPSQCTYCSTAFGVSLSLISCQSCLVANCKFCNANSAICTQCVDGYGLMSGNVCSDCTAANCIDCYPNPDTCIKCIKGYGVNGNACVTCSNSNCEYCPDNYATCTVCKPPFGVSFGSCTSCHTKCGICHPSNYSLCITCAPGYYNNTLTNDCSPCISNCLACLSGNTCQQCQIPLFFNTTTDTCVPCPDNCTICFQDSILSLPSCTACIDLYNVAGLQPGISAGYCAQDCGDGTTTYYACDMPVGVPLDGCTDRCQVQTGFVCQNRQVCSYTGLVQMSMVSVVREKMSNRLNIVIEVRPKLHVFSSGSIEGLFRSTNPSMVFTGVSYDPVQGRFTFTGDFTEDMVNTSHIGIEFAPSLGIDSRYYATPSNSAQLIFPQLVFHQAYFYSTFSHLVANLVYYLSFVSIALGILSLFFGAYLKRLAGLQAMWVLQISYVNMVFLSSYLHVQMEQAQPLKYSCGYSLMLMAENAVTRYPSVAPYLQQFGLSGSNFLNNFNIMIAFQVLPLLAAIFCYLRILHFLHDYQPIEGVYVKPQRLRDIQTHYQTCLQLLLYFTGFNIINYTMSLQLQLTHNPTYLIPNLVFMSMAGLLFLLVLLKFFIDPDPFGYFRYSFRYTEKSCIFQLRFKHIIVYFITIFLTQSFMVLLPSLPFMPLIPIFLFLIFTFAYLPYKEPKQNYRSAFNVFVMCSMMGLRIYLSYQQYPWHNNTIANVWMLINYGAMNVAVSAIALGTLIYYFVYIHYIRPKLDEEDQYFRQNKQKLEVLNQLGNLNVRKVVQENIDEENVFKKVGIPKKSILEYSNQLFKDAIYSQRELFGTKNPIDLSRIDQEVPKINVGQEGISKQLLQKQARNKQAEGYESVNKKAHKKLTSYEKLAREVLIDENTFINIKHSDLRLQDEGKATGDKNMELYIEQYDRIGILSASNQKELLQQGSETKTPKLQQ